MGFRSVFVTEDYGQQWPEWFKVKYGAILNLGIDGKGVLSAKKPFKQYERGDGLLDDIHQAIDWDYIEKSRSVNGGKFVLVYLHDCGGVTRVEISRSAIRLASLTDYIELDEILHDGCYGCSDLPRES